MNKFIIPDKVTVRLIKPRQQDFPVDNILLYIKTYARHKNDFCLGPFVSDQEGIISITKNEIEREVTATYESGLMDYSGIENCFTFVELRLYDQDEIDKMIKSRSKVWTTLLKGEKERWTSINHLIETLKKSNNKHLLLYDSTKRVRADFDGTQNEYEFQLDIYKR